VNAIEKLPAGFPFNPKQSEDLLPLLPLDIFKLPNKRDFFKDSHELLMGMTSDEGAAILTLTFPDIFTMEGIKLNITSLEHMKELIETKFAAGFNLKEEYAVILSEVFFPPDIKNISTPALVKMLYRVLGDLAFTCPITSFAQEMLEYGKTVYMFEFAQRAKASPWGEWMGITHGDEYVFAFGHPLRYPERYSLQDIELSKRMILTWSEFARTGKPPRQLEESWPAYSLEEQEFAVLKGDAFRSERRLREDVCTLFRRGIEN
jgi:carboxylesterase type B